MSRTIDFLTNIYKSYGYIFQGRWFSEAVLFYKLSRTTESLRETFSEVYKHRKSIKVYGGSILKQYRHLLDEVDIDIESTKHFIYSWDIYKSMRLDGRAWGNCTVDYSRILDSGLDSFHIDGDDDFAFTNNELLRIILEYINRLSVAVEHSPIENKCSIISCLKRFKSEKAVSLEEALQRILIINQLQWQTGHILVGLGRLDLILDRFIEDEYKARELFSEFFELLHKYYIIKSNALIGDTGQIVILGGCDKEGNSFWGRYTKLIAEIIRKLRIPDPKILFRVSSETDKEQWKWIIEHVIKSPGSVLLSNDDVVIKNMVEFGYDIEDARDYTTSACWEPVAYGCFEQNNILSINYLEPFERLSKKIRYNNDAIRDYESFLEVYLSALEEYVSEKADKLIAFKWNKDPFYSMFDAHACQMHKDVSNGGSKYNNIGILTVALGNAINSLENIKRYVYEEKAYSYTDLEHARKHDYSNLDDLRLKLKENANYWGHDDARIYELANRITLRTIETLNKYRTKLGGRFKIGFSSPHYIMDSKYYPASFDGRKCGAPFGVHISARNGIAYTELLNLAAKLDYSKGRFNGDVVDMIVSPGFIDKHKDEFIQLFRVAFLQGVCQLQVNLLDSRTLIAAKERPCDYNDLIVRVWGFNAYFNDLPEEYKDNLIERTKLSELANNIYTEVLC